MTSSRILAGIALVLAVSTTACVALSHPPMSRADVRTTDPGGDTSGLTRVWSPISAVVTVTDAGVGATGSTATWSKTGRASCRNIFGLVAFGDASVETAAHAAGITQIHHVDAEAFRIWRFYSAYTTVVYGD